MPTPFETILRQLQVEQTLLKFSYSPDPALEQDVLNGIANFFVSQGMTNLMHCSKFSTLAASIGAPTLGLDYIVNTDTGARLNLDYRYDFPKDYQIYALDVQFTADNIPIVVPKYRVIQTGGLISGFLQALGPLAPVISIFIAVFIPGLGLAIGEEIMGLELAAIAPAFTQAIGSLCINAVLSGGDIKDAIKNTALSYVGAQIAAPVAQGIQDATNSGLLGNVAQAATLTAISGGDIKTAVAGSLLQTGASNIGAYIQQSQAPAVAPAVTQGAPKMDASTFVGPIDTSTFVGPIDTSTAPGAGVNIDLTPVNFTGIDFGTNPNLPDFTNPTDLAAIAAGGGATADSAPAQVAGTGSADASGVNWNQVVNNVSQVAIAALKVNAAFQSAGKPTVRVASQVTNANGTVSTVNADGTVTTRARNGVTSTVPLPVGSPFVLPNGSMVVNNGDGTYSTIAANGQQTTSRYGSVLSGSGSNPLLWLGLAAVAAYALIR